MGRRGAGSTREMRDGTGVSVVRFDGLEERWPLVGVVAEGFVGEEW